MKYKSCIPQYLEKYAEPEAREFKGLSRDFPKDCAVVIPLCGEPFWLTDGLPALETSARKTGKTSLVILVVNEMASTFSYFKRQNQVLLSELTSLRTQTINPFLFFAKYGTLDLLVVDRITHVLPPKTGVGLARKIGMDLALAAFSQKQILSAFVHTTDGDAIVSPDYFTSLPHINSLAGTHPFVHQIDETNPELILYDLYLHYYRLGLEYAGSPYAYHSIGSTFVIRLDAYAAVRGFPPIEAGEDFYLLNKIRKLGTVESLREGPVTLRPRSGIRVPFGTNQAVEKIRTLKTAQDADSEMQIGYMLFNPLVFELLKSFLIEATRVLTSKEGTLRQSESHCPEDWVLWDKHGFLDLIRKAFSLRNSAIQRCRHFNDSFDALKTLQFLHLMRDRGYPNLPWQSALRQSPFIMRSCFNHL